MKKTSTAAAASVVTDKTNCDDLKEGEVLGLNVIVSSSPDATYAHLVSFFNDEELFSGYKPMWQVKTGVFFNHNLNDKWNAHALHCYLGTTISPSILSNKPLHLSFNDYHCSHTFYCLHHPARIGKWVDEMGIFLAPPHSLINSSPLRRSFSSPIFPIFYPSFLKRGLSWAVSR